MPAHAGIHNRISGIPDNPAIDPCIRRGERQVGSWVFLGRYIYNKNRALELANLESIIGLK